MPGPMNVKFGYKYFLYKRNIIMYGILYILAPVSYIYKLNDK
jgi:hypothetical protein